MEVYGLDGGDGFTSVYLSLNSSSCIYEIRIDFTCQSCQWSVFFFFKEYLSLGFPRRRSQGKDSRTSSLSRREETGMGVGKWDRKEKVAKKTLPLWVDCHLISWEKSRNQSPPSPEGQGSPDVYTPTPVSHPLGPFGSRLDAKYVLLCEQQGGLWCPKKALRHRHTGSGSLKTVWHAVSL